MIATVVYLVWFVIVASCLWMQFGPKIRFRRRYLVTVTTKYDPKVLVSTMNWSATGLPEPEVKPEIRNYYFDGYRLVPDYSTITFHCKTLAHATYLRMLFDDATIEEIRT